MSGFLGVVQAIGLSLGGPAPVTLGGTTFQELEVPEKAIFGGKQMLAVHKLPGGARVIDALGRDDADIRWSGIFEGPTATQRALEIDQMRVDGVPVPLSWDSLSWTVMVAEFMVTYVHRNWITYQIRCVVVQDNSQGAFGNQLSFLPTDVQNDLNSAFNSIMPIANTVQAAIPVAQAALGVAGAFVKNSGPFASAMAALSQVSGGVSDVQLAADGNLAGVAGGVQGVAGILGATRAVNAVGQIQTLGQASGSLAGAVQQAGYVNRAISNMTSSVAG